MNGFQVQDPVRKLDLHHDLVFADTRKIRQIGATESSYASQASSLELTIEFQVGIAWRRVLLVL